MDENWGYPYFRNPPFFGTSSHSVLCFADWPLKTFSEMDFQIAPVIFYTLWSPVHCLQLAFDRRLIDGTVDDMSVLGGHRGSYRIAAGPLPADANPTDCQYDAR